MGTPKPTPKPTPPPTEPPTYSKGTTTATTMVGAAKCLNPGSCIVWGDPHILTFDAHGKRLMQHPHREAFFRTRNWKLDEVTVTDEGTFWLVRSDDVHIQGRYEANTSNANVTNLVS